MMTVEKEEKIIEILEESGHGLTINEISEQVGLYRATASKYLMLMEARGLVTMRQVGPAKVYLPKRHAKEVARRVERAETAKKKDWVDRLVSEIKSEVKEGTSR